MFRNKDFRSMNKNERPQECVRNTALSSIDIFIFSNGDESSPPRKYHLRNEELSWWEATRNYLARSQYGNIDSGIDIYTLNGHKIENPIDLIDGGVYVAVSPTDGFVEAGYDKYLIKASRSWEKRRQQKLSEDDSLPPDSSHKNGKSTKPVKLSNSEFSRGSKTLPKQSLGPRSSLRNNIARGSFNNSNELIKRNNASPLDLSVDKSKSIRSAIKNSSTTPVKTASIIKKKENPDKINPRLHDPTRYKNTDSKSGTTKQTRRISTNQQTITKVNPSNNNIRKSEYERVNKKQTSNNNLNNNKNENNSPSYWESKVSVPDLYINAVNVSNTQILQVHENGPNTIMKLLTHTDSQLDSGLRVKSEEEFRNLLNHVVERVFTHKSKTASSETATENEVALKKKSHFSSNETKATDHNNKKNLALTNNNHVMNLKLQIEVNNEPVIPIRDHVASFEFTDTEKVEKESKVNIHLDLIAKTVNDTDNIVEDFNSTEQEMMNVDQSQNSSFVNPKPVVVYCCSAENKAVNSCSIDILGSKKSTKKYVLLAASDTIHEENVTCTCYTKYKVIDTDKVDCECEISKEHIPCTKFQSRPKIFEINSDQCDCTPEKDNSEKNNYYYEKKETTVFSSQTEIFETDHPDACFGTENDSIAVNISQSNETKILKPASARTIDKSSFIPTEEIKSKHTYFDDQKSPICTPCPCPADFLITRRVLKCPCPQDIIQKYTVNKYSMADQQPLNEKNNYLITKSQLEKPVSVTEFMVVKKHNTTEMLDASTQTDWCDILLEATITQDGHYSFRLPSLNTLRKYNV